MIAISICIALVIPAQSISGVKAIEDPTPKFAQAYLKVFNETPALATSPDPFVVAYFMMKAKVMVAVVNTKYTAAQVGICGTMLGLYDAQLASTIKTASDRITKGTKDFDSFTRSERDAIEKGMSESSINPIGKDTLTTNIMWQHFAGANLGMLEGYLCVWYISAKQEILLNLIRDSIKGCAEQATKAGASSRQKIADTLKGFGPFVGKPIEETMLRNVGKQVENTLQASLPIK